MVPKCLKDNSRRSLYYISVTMFFINQLLFINLLAAPPEESENDQNPLPVTNQLTPSNEDNVQDVSILEPRSLSDDSKLESISNPTTNNDQEICSPTNELPMDLPLDYEDCKTNLKECLRKPHPDQDKSVPELLDTYGYPFEEHKVTTSDLYILTVFRILGSPKLNQNTTRHGTPVFLNHGLTCSADWWFLVPPNKSLALMLADVGYDVWLNNNRGTSYSLEHEKHNWEIDLCYWDYSFHELGIYDVPAVTDRILEISKRENILYIGHSMGTTQFFISLAELPEMNDKIKAAFLLSPVAYSGHTDHFLRYFAPLFGNFEAYKALDLAFQGRLGNMKQLEDAFKVSSGDLCSVTAIKCGVCDNFLFAIFGFNAPQMNYTEIPHIFAKYPNSQSIKTMVHYLQHTTSCRFVKFNYTPEMNLIKYGSIYPPEYNLTNINVPLYMFLGQHDYFTVPQDMDILLSKLRPGVVKEMYTVKDKLFTHMDFLTAIDIDKLLYNQLLIYMEHNVDKNISQTL